MVLGTPVVFFLFIQHIIANICVFTIWWKITLLEAAVYGDWCYLSPGFCNKVKSCEVIFILDASPSNSLSTMAIAFRMSCFLYWHLKAWLIPTSSGCKWLMQFRGKKHKFSIFQSSDICWMCNILVNVEQDFSVLAPIWWSICSRNSSKVAKVFHELEFTMYLLGYFYISEAVGFVVLAGFQCG